MKKIKKKIAITGLSGVIGQVLGKEIIKTDTVIDLFNSRKYTGTGKIQHVKLDLKKTKKIKGILKRTNPDVIIHLAAKTHIDACEKDKKNGKKGDVWKVNVDATFEIAKYAASNNVHLIFLSTECVFDGKSKYFSEKSKKNPINWYGSTKSEAEDLITSTKGKTAIVRSVVAYHINDHGKTIYGKIVKSLKSHKSFDAVDDYFFTPTNTSDIVKAIELIADKNLKGIFHVTSKKAITPYDFAKLVAKNSGYKVSLIKKKKMASVYSTTRASLRLKNASLSGEISNRAIGLSPKNPREVLS